MATPHECPRCDGSGVDPEDVNRIVAALLLLGVVNVTDRPVPYMPPFKAKTTAPAPAPTPTVVAPPPGAADEVMAAYLSYRRKDAFDLLDVLETEGLPAINDAYLRISEKFLPSTQLYLQILTLLGIY